MPYQVNPYIRKTALYDGKVLHISEAMYSLIRGAIDDDNQKELQTLCDTIRVECLNIPSGLLALPMQPETKL